MLSRPSVAPTVRFSTISTGTGKAPPRSWTPRSFASCAVKRPVITAAPPAIPEEANSGPTVGALINWLSKKMPMLRPVPARFFVSSANSSPPRVSNRIATFQLLLAWVGSPKASLRFFPVSPLLSNRSMIAQLLRFNASWFFSIAAVSPVFLNWVCFASSSCRTCCSTKSCASVPGFCWRNSNWAVPPSTRSACCGSLTPGNWTRIWSCPTVCTTASETPRPLIRPSTTLWTASNSRSVICLISALGFTWIVSCEPPWRSNPKGIGILAITVIAAITKTRIKINSPRCFCIPWSAADKRYNNFLFSVMADSFSTPAGLPFFALLPQFALAAQSSVALKRHCKEWEYPGKPAAAPVHLIHQTSGH